MSEPAIPPRDLIRQIKTIQLHYLLIAAQTVAYGVHGKWGEKFVLEEAARASAEADKILVDVTGLSDKEAYDLGFTMWDAKSGMRLIPLWLYRHLAPGQTLFSISDIDKPNPVGILVAERSIYLDSKSNDYLDNDHRGGSTAYGFVPKH